MSSGSSASFMQAAPPAPPRPATPRADVPAQVQATTQDAQNAAKDAAAKPARELRITTSDGQTITIPAGVIPGLPGIRGGDAFDNSNLIPPQVETISIAFFVMIAFISVGFPLARAFARRMDRGALAPALTPALTEQLHRIEQAVDTMAVEVERISESQRFIARLQQGSTAERV